MPPQPRLYRIAQRIAARFQPDVRDAFLAAIAAWSAAINLDDLTAALAGGATEQIEAALFSAQPSPLMGDDVAELLARIMAASGTSTASALGNAIGASIAFDSRDLNMILAARTITADMVVDVTETTKEALRIITASGAFGGVTTTQQARIMREIVGLPPNWVMAPLNLADELREGREAAATSRRLSAVDKQKIRSRIRAGTVDEDFVHKMRGRYTKSLLNRRALNIAGTESRRAAHTGQRISWGQARDDGLLAPNTRKQAVVTPDDRLRETHARVPRMNPGGVALDEPYDTPWGKRDGPPWEPNCRCGEALFFPSTGRRL